MNILKIKHLDFVPGMMVSEEHSDFIFVFTHKRNGKLRKKKIDCVGEIFKHPKTNKWVFLQEPNWCQTAESLSMIVCFLDDLDRKLIKYKEEKGELLACRQISKRVANEQDGNENL